MPPTVAAMVVGPLLGVWLFRFGVSEGWAALVCLAGVVIASFILLTNTDIYGSAGVAWLGGFVGGSNIGVGWRAAAKNRKAMTTKKSAWLVDGRGLDTPAEVRPVAEAALRAGWQRKVAFGRGRTGSAV